MTSFELHVDMSTSEARVRLGDSFIPAEHLLADPDFSEAFKASLRDGLRQFNLLDGEACHD